MAVKIKLPPGVMPPWDPWSTLTAEQFNEFQADPVGYCRRYGGGKAVTEKKRPKFNNEAGHQADLGGLYFRSKMEANWLRYLIHLHGYQLWLQKDEPTEPGRWAAYERRKFTWEGGVYKVDLELWPGWFDPSRPYELHEIKGAMTKSSKTRANGMRKHYADVPIELVTRERMQPIVAGAAAVIPGWQQ